MVLVIKNLPVGVGDARYVRSIPGSERSPGAGNGNPLQYSRLDKYHELRSLADYSPWGCKESDMTERVSTHAIIGCWL